VPGDRKSSRVRTIRLTVLFVLKSTVRFAKIVQKGDR
jgi:hypothetical protein